MSWSIEEIAVGDFKPWAKSARTHSRKQLRQIAESIRTFGFANLVLIDSANTILAGHGRVEAAKLIGMTIMPCVRLEHMTPEQKRAYVLVDNKLALNAGWDEELLAEELQALMGVDDLGFDIGVTGFYLGEIDTLVTGLSIEEPGTRKMMSCPLTLRVGPVAATSGNSAGIGLPAGTRSTGTSWPGSCRARRPA